MRIHLWHFTGPQLIEQIRRIGLHGERDDRVNFSLPGERHWENGWGPGLVEVWLEMEKDALAPYQRATVVGGRHIVFYQIPNEVVNYHIVEMRIHDNADHLPRTSEGYPEMSC